MKLTHLIIIVVIIIIIRSSANAKRAGSADVAEILKGNPKYIGASLTQCYAHFSSGCGLMVGLGKLKSYAKFEVPSFSHCVNIEVEPQNFGAQF